MGQGGFSWVFIVVLEFFRGLIGVLERFSRGWVGSGGCFGGMGLVFCAWVRKICKDRCFLEGVLAWAVGCGVFFKRHGACYCNGTKVLGRGRVETGIFKGNID